MISLGKMKEAVKECETYLGRLAASGISGVANCQYVALLAANLGLIRSEITAAEREGESESDGRENSDNICER